MQISATHRVRLAVCFCFFVRAACVLVLVRDDVDTRTMSLTPLRELLQRFHRNVIFVNMALGSASLLSVSGARLTPRACARPRPRPRALGPTLEPPPPPPPPRAGPQLEGEKAATATTTTAIARAKPTDAFLGTAAAAVAAGAQ